MTAITPLEFIHKKGTFGDHHKKYEKDLIQISEVKNLSIIQVFQFKKSNTEIKNIRLDGLEFPVENSKVSSNKDTRILWSGPKTWLIISNQETIINIVKQKCDDKNFAVTDISHSRAVIQIRGLQAKEVLKKGCPLNFNEYRANYCSGSVFHGITILVDQINDNPDTFNILALRSFGESLYHHITDAALEYGYSGV